ncbi:phosphopantetheine binding protein [Paenibacillus cellulosilyticus]|uniref:Phosphopantetheine binding protein n=1 Tax=Paenibacillus cellulosilyticus TaxID=375489 RepID=A0A2V2YYW5_9BACL|nr:SDR family oxidoreductase [Paenibacillus cellulosilyticus]PWW07329.1 phosphopantetheine binding protein [Paenibacillus cellulosilyticus]QKS44492.1 SDR family oxidoreductase [Paenibacillus cellulosilyticus]
MEQLLRMVVDGASRGKIDKETAIQLVNQIKESESTHEDVAIIGMSGQMPMAESPAEYWANLESGLDCVTAFPETRKNDITKYLRHVGTENPRFSENAYLGEIDKFDHAFFKLSYKEASLMDPHQRLFLVNAWQAIEDAGYGGGKISGTKTGVYAGFASSLRDMYIKQVYETDPESLPLAMVGNLPAVLPSRISYLLDLKGPSMLIDTACSSSLVSIALAVEALRKKTCEMVLAGGIKINLMPLDNENMKIGIESSDSRTRAFNHHTSGSGIGEGVGVVLLKPLSRALKDRDHIYAVVKGCAVNQDGRSVGLTAPNPAAQREVMIQAWKDSGIDPATISYIETHGTGTKIGDPIEIRGIEEAFRGYTNKKQFCAIGSVKTNIGHASEAAGIFGVIKIVQAMRNRKLPPSLYFQVPNRTIAFEKSPVYVNTALREWPSSGQYPRRAGISGFGISGTNCHIVLEEAPAVPERSEGLPVYLLAISADNEESLRELALRYRSWLLVNEDCSLLDFCYTANTGRGHYSDRVICKFETREEVVAQLGRWLNGEVAAGVLERIRTHSKSKPEAALTEAEKRALTEEAEGICAEYLLSSRTDVTCLSRLMEQYIAGADFVWDGFFKDRVCHKVSLPVYPFRRTRCWLDLPEIPLAASSQESYYYQVSWIESPAPAAEPIKEDTVIVFGSEEHDTDQIAEKFSLNGADVVRVSFGSQFEADGNRIVVTGTPDDFEALVKMMETRKLSRILYGVPLGDRQANTLDELLESQKVGVYSLVYLIQSMVRHGMDQHIAIQIVGRNLYAVSGQEKEMRPEFATLAALGKTVSLEHPGIRVRTVDFDDVFSLEDLWVEMYRNDPMYQAAYRQGKRYVERFEEVQAETLQEETVQIAENGVYLITGGTGGMGLELAHSLSLRNRVRLVLISRSGLPPREEWEELVNAGKDSSMRSRLMKVMEIASNGSEILSIAADVSDPDQMRAAIELVREQYGTIHGIVHAAGVPGEGFLLNKSRQAFDTVFNPKVYGTWLIDSLTREFRPEFMVLCSSGLSILSEPGHGDYTAANAYLDLYAKARARTGLKTLTINWTTWKETGMAVEYGFNYDTFFKAMPTSFAIERFYEALDHKITNVLIGEFSYLPQFLALLDHLPFMLSDSVQDKCRRALENSGKKQIQAGPNIQTARNVDLIGGSDFTEIEKEVAQIYYEVLGSAEINIDDGFFELGGDSVILNRMHALIEKKFPGTVKLIDLFNYTTVRKLSKHIAEKTGKSTTAKAESTELESITSMLEQLQSGDMNLEEAVKHFIDS